MKAGWQYKTLNHIAENLDGKRVPITKNVRSSGAYPYYGASGIVDFVGDYIFDGDLLLVSEDGANLLARTYPIAFSISGKAWVNNHAHVLRFKENVTQKLVEYYLNSIPLNDYVSGMAQPKLNQKMLNTIPVPFPPLSEQQRIVTILDEAFEGIATATANAKKNLANARELFESYLQSVFTSKGEGWLTKNLSEVCLIKPPKSEAKINLDMSDLVSFIPMESLGISQKYFDASRVRTLKEVAGSYTYFANGDVLLAKITPCFENGKLGIARNLKNGVGFGSSEYIVFRTLPALHNEYLYYFLFRKSFIEEGSARMTGAVGHKRVAKEFIENTLIILPPFAKQEAIVTKLDELSAEIKGLEAIYQQKLTALDELKKSILNQAFSGQLN